MTERLKTFLDINTFVMRGGNIGSNWPDLDATTQDKIKQFVNAMYDEVAYKRIWSWRETTRWLRTTATLTTGTVSASTDDRIITFSAAVTVTDDFKGRFIKIGSDSEYYEIIAVTDLANRKCALSAPYAGTTDATATYTCWRAKYGLWPDFADLAHVVPVTNGQFIWERELTLPSVQDFVPLISPFQALGISTPTHACVMGKEAYRGPEMGPQFVMGYDFMDDPGNTDDDALFLAPVPQSTSVLVVYYGKRVDPLSEDTDEPMLPIDKRLVLAYGALELWHATQTQDMKMTSYFAKKKEEALNSMVADFDQSDSVARLVPYNYRGNRMTQSVIRKYYPWLVR